MRHFMRMIGAAGVAAAGMSALPAHAAVTTVVSNWTNSTGGTFSGNNWDNGVPSDDTGGTLANRAVFGLDNTYTVHFSGDTATYEADVEGGDVTLDLGGHAYNVNTDSKSRFFVGRNLHDSAVLTIANGTLHAYGSTLANQGSTGADVTLTNATWTTDAAMIVGNNGVGKLTVNSNATGSSGSFTLGSKNIASGTAVIYGSWTNSGSITVGDGGPGDLKLLGGGAMQGASVFIGNSSTAGDNSIGTVAVSGVGAALTGSTAIYVGGNSNGARGTGTLSIGDRVVDSVSYVGGKVGTPALTVWNTGTLNLSGHGDIGDATTPAAVTLKGGAMNLSGVNNVITGDVVMDSSAGAAATTITLDAGSDAGFILNVSGNLTTSGTLDVALGDIQLTGDSSFNLFDWAGQAGGSTPATSTLSFSGVTLPTLDNGWTWDQSKLSSEGIIRIAVPEPGTAALLGIGVMGLLLKRRCR
jgi:T5SS/PEP-CTERM-associated repeat protein